jgi:hypothetical protein
MRAADVTIPTGLGPRTIEYRGYALMLEPHGCGWQVRIYHTMMSLPSVRPADKFVALSNRDEAIAEACRRVDVLLRSAIPFNKPDASNDE